MIVRVGKSAKNWSLLIKIQFTIAKFNSNG